MYEYGCIILFFVVIFIIVYIKIKYPFWNIQPVYHSYDFWRYFSQTSFIIQRKLPIKTKFYDNKHVETVVFSEMQDFHMTRLIDLLQCPYLKSIVVCAALGATALLRPLGLRLPLMAVHGYSVTAPLRLLEAHPDLGPRAAVMDEAYKVAISRLGLRVRVAGSAEVGGRLDRHDPAALQTLYAVLDDWFPGSAQLAQAQAWKGARPMLPDGPPVLGASGRDGVWLNLGHGSSGWALSCGSARIVADLIAGRTPAIATDGLGIARLRT